ncbi:hypothetical protein [uncultured Pedobacter sp.]|uniref:hypothetical protein n=1 Tax=uncultured Pedobacter sp. TaxID=246139 RepID=UPI0025EFC03F|nr:hypothetical protein [uncultured Pedobacter sp.]
MEANKNENEQQEQRLTKQEQLAQAALGNTEAIQSSTDSNIDIMSIPDISGTGSNPSAAAPHSLIVHEDENGEKKYEEGSTETSSGEQK